jgi:CrcB protein
VRLLVIAVGGALGSVARYTLCVFVQRWTSALFPLGTFTVNVLGCLLFGIILGLGEERFMIGPDLRAFLLIGVLGGFTTFSTFAFDTVVLAGERDLALAVLIAGGQVLAGAAALWLGAAVGRLA